MFSTSHTHEASKKCFFKTVRGCAGSFRFVKENRKLLNDINKK